MSILDMAAAVEVQAAEFKTPIANSQENLEKLAKACEAKFGTALKVNAAVIKSGGLMPDGARRVPLAVTLKTRPGGSLTVWVDRADPAQLNCIWSGVVTASLLDEAGVDRL
jgi:hypothetical protein